MVNSNSAASCICEQLILYQWLFSILFVTAGVIRVDGATNFSGGSNWSYAFLRTMTLTTPFSRPLRADDRLPDGNCGPLIPASSVPIN